jgi:hypothetical protein
MISLSPSRVRAEPAAMTARAVLSFCDGERLVVDVDAENAGYLRAAFARRGKHSFDWFETMDGFLVGVDLGAIETIDWHPPAVSAPVPSRPDRHHLALRFSPGGAERLAQISPDDIDRLRGATIGGCAGKCFKPNCTDAPAAPIPLQRLRLATLPACWMDAEGG